MIAHGRDEARADVARALGELTARRVAREPVAYILGEREFWGLVFKVSPAVLVPRPDSETMIEAALSILPDRARPWRLLDLGLGSGCLLLTLLRELPEAQGVGLEASAEALAVARRNAAELGVLDRARLTAGDWRQAGWAEALGGPFDLVVSNPPYIEASAIDRLMPDVARYEPRLALDGGADGLAAYRLIAAESRRLVAPDGHLLVEIGQGQASEIATIFGAVGMRAGRPWHDLAGIPRVVPLQH